MRPLLIALPWLLFTSGFAHASGTSRALVSTGSLFSSSYLTSSDRKLVSAAQDDASVFIASEGSVRGPYLEAALRQVRAAHPDLRATDMELASAVLANPPTLD
ncbi:DUF2388 domain-containing protein [Pseudomonas entomophila]|uniref:DUF2388 domain-containing protein n=1 Tax=Pseudomonas entomophila TaxID=312306 RepID=UPI0023D7E9F2|nr:DUF2388 domain-containing protein [Pseudomonas entomophila]MDF0733278.1 DUF2388 domain-containing protein [Pseudomonas entomophila]